MEIRDAIHGIVVVDPSELPILDSRYFQRLRQIKQLGFAENSFPSATHNRYIHSLGAMHTASQVFDRIFRRFPQSFERWRAVLRLAALLHDVGHGPLSHTTEFAMPEVKDLQLPICVPVKNKHRKATHEDYTLKMILDSGLTPLLEKTGARLGFKPIHIACLIDPKIETPETDFFDEVISDPNFETPRRISFRPILQQIISSELDADRMDYLRRDSLLAGVSYGHFDSNWLIGNLTYHFQDEKCFLSLQHRALYAFEDFLISRFHMFLMIYFHHKSVIFDEMLAQYFASSDCDYRLPSDIEAYCESNDSHLYSHLSNSQNPWAKRIVQKHAYRVLIELHSGIPATLTSKTEQKKLLQEIKKDLEAKGIHYLEVTSTSELSKYFNQKTDPIFVRYDNHYNSPTYIPLEQCTDLFRKYSEKRTITRLYVSPEDYHQCRQQRDNSPLKFEENPG